MSTALESKSKTGALPMSRNIENLLIAAVVLGSIFAALAFVMGGVYGAFLFVGMSVGPFSLLLLIPVMESKPKFPGFRLAAVIAILLMFVGGFWCTLTLDSMQSY